MPNCISMNSVCTFGFRKHFTDCVLCIKGCTNLFSVQSSFAYKAQ